MCGIAGFTHQERPAAGLISRIAGSIAHRGPDQSGVYESAHVSLAAVRLKIIDLSGGDQPFFSPDRNTALVFNGEIYNHRELRLELEARGHVFVSHCDTEVALHAFLEWDTGCFARLRGMFALAVWDERGGRLVLARDRMGIKPLYICRYGGQLFFGSELKTILAHPRIPRRLDTTALQDFLCLNYVPGPRTLVEGIEKLPPGHFLEWRRGQIRIEPWWKLELRPDRKWTVDAAVEALDDLLRAAVREHLVSDVPLGIWSSGGLDSSTILHYAAQASPVRLKTFSVSFRGRSFDETPWFREAARVYGTDHHEFDLNPEVELADAIQEFAYYSDEPSADAGALPVWFLSRMSRRSVTVALSGDGADELFGGYITYLADRVSRQLRMVPERARRAALSALRLLLPVSDDKIGLEYKLKRGLEGAQLHPDEAHFFWNGACSPEQKRQLLPGLEGHRLGRLAAVLPGPEAGLLNRYMMADQLYYLPDDILYKVDRMSMAHSLEVRPPFLDHRIVEFAASLPQDFKVRGFRLKFVLRRLMKDKLPASILRRAKTGFDIPAHHWFRGVLKPLLLDQVSPAAVRATGLFDADAVGRLIRDHMERRINAGYQLWGLLTLFVWMKRWNIEALPAGESVSETGSQALAIN